MKLLIKEKYPIIRSGKYTRKTQSEDIGSFHLANELDKACYIDLESPTTARKLLNLLRGRTFPGHPCCHFVDKGISYDVTVTISKKK